jgi:hypothetical protein
MTVIHPVPGSGTDVDARVPTGASSRGMAHCRVPPHGAIRPGVAQICGLPWPAGLLGALFVCAVLGGCSREYWRDQADDRAYDIIVERENDPRWTNPRIDVIPDVRSRFYDPYDPDEPPLPPDDPAANEYMRWVYGKRGWKHWHKFGQLETVENPCWLNPYGMSEQQVIDNYHSPGNYPEIGDLSLEEAIELAYIHSRDFQTQIENVYLAALALSAERFRFDVQFVGLNSRRPSMDLNFTDVPNVNDQLNWTPRAGASQLLPAGGQWLVELANSTLWIWADGKATDATASTLSYSIVQPLLANGGRRFVMENLTQLERNMLYAVRDFARFRMGFFTATVAGGSQAGLASGVGGISTGVGALTSAVSQGGYLGLLQQSQVIINQQFNIRLLRERLNRSREQASQPLRISVPLEKLPEGLEFPPEFEGRVTFRRVQILTEQGRIEEQNRLFLRGRLSTEERQQLLALSDDPLYRMAINELADQAGSETFTQTVAQLETQLAAQCNQLRTAQVNLLNQIDQYKLHLGLPPSMGVTIDMSLLKPFELVDQRLLPLQDRLNNFVPDPPMQYENHPDAESMRRVDELMRQLDGNDPQLDVLRGLVIEMYVIRDDLFRDGIRVLEEDFARAQEHRRLHPAAQEIDSCFDIVHDPARAEMGKNILISDFREQEARLQELRRILSNPEPSLDERIGVLRELADLREEFLKITQGISGVQVNLRMELIDINPFDATLEDALRTALANRLDLMNAQAQVMDARRRVEVAANQLLAVLNITAAGDIRTLPVASGNDSPFEFRGDQSSIRAGVQFTSPIQLVNQRNTYRAALIGLYQARRNYMRVEDQVKFDVRTTWRTLQVLRQNFRTAKANLRAAVAQYDIAVEQSAAPTGAGTGGLGGGGGGGGGGGAQGLNILNALNSLLQAQNNLIQIWIQFETNRLNIHNFMGILELDEQGFWVDEFYQNRALALRAGRGLAGHVSEETSRKVPPSTIEEPTDVPPNRAPEDEPMPAASRRAKQPPGVAARRGLPQRQPIAQAGGVGVARGADRGRGGAAGNGRRRVGGQILPASRGEEVREPHDRGGHQGASRDLDHRERQPGKRQQPDAHLPG